MYALATYQLQAGGERVIEPIKWMRSPHTPATGGEAMSHRVNQVDAASPTHQLQVERRES